MQYNAWKCIWLVENVRVMPWDKDGFRRFIFLLRWYIVFYIVLVTKVSPVTCWPGWGYINSLPPEGNTALGVGLGLLHDSLQYLCFLSHNMRSQLHLQAQWQSLLPFHLMWIFCYTVLLHSNTLWLPYLLCVPMITHFLLFLASGPHMFSKKRHMFLLQSSMRFKHIKRENENKWFPDKLLNYLVTKCLFSALTNAFSVRLKVQIFKTARVTL